MTLEAALRATEMLLALAICQHSAEHLIRAGAERTLAVARIALAGCVLIGVFVPLAVWGLWGAGLLLLRRFDGPYNGGADKMVMLALTCVALAHLAPDAYWRGLALGYLAVQLILSYFVSGYIKIINPDWRRGIALGDVFRYSAYPVADNLRALADRPRLMRAGSWAVMGLEVVFPLSLLSPLTLYAALAAVALFHVANGCLFGLNRFVWAWISAFPALIWFQERMVG